MREAFAKLRDEMHGSLRGIILDMRGNPGGLLDQSVAVADSFMASGRIVATRGRNTSSFQEFAATSADIAAGLRIAVRMNGGSASAAQTVAPACQDSCHTVV